MDNATAPPTPTAPEPVLSARTLAFMQSNNLTVHSTFVGEARRFVVKREDGKFAIAKPDRKHKGGLNVGVTAFDDASTAMAKLKHEPATPASMGEPATIGQSG